VGVARQDKVLATIQDLVARYGSEDVTEWLTKIYSKWAEYKLNTKCYTCESTRIRWVGDYEYECDKGHRSKLLGLQSWELGVPPWFMRVLADRGIVDILYRSRSTTTYGVPDEVMRVLERILRSETSLAPTEGVPEVEEVPEPTLEMFSDIVGLDDVKKLVLDVLTSSKPVHLLLVGPTASAKTMILETISRHYDVPILLAGASTRAGLRDYILDNVPEVMLIDELDKVSNPLDLSTLLTWMESQRLVVTMATKKAHVRCPSVCRVIAAANSIRRIPPELLSRFVVVNLKPYTDEEIRTVCINVLTRREGCSEEMAKTVAEAVVSRLGSKDPRDCVKIARLAKTPEDVDRIVEILRGRRAR
jgi:Holliday junction DNA helicase RuvB